MKKIYFLSLAVIVLFFSCQKSNTLKPITTTPPVTPTTPTDVTPTPNYFITCDVDGVAKSFNANASATKTTTTWNFTILDFKGLISAAGSETLSIGIDNSLSADSIVAGTYSDTSSKFSLEALYVSPSATDYSAGTAVSVKTQSAINHLTTTITSFSNGEIKGTFSGDFYLNSDPTSTKKSITNGSFYVKVK